MSTSPASQVLYTIPQAAAALAISRSRVYELLAHGDLTAIHIGRSARVSARAIDTYVARLESGIAI